MSSNEVLVTNKVIEEFGGDRENPFEEKVNQLAYSRLLELMHSWATTVDFSLRLNHSISDINRGSSMIDSCYSRVILAVHNGQVNNEFSASTASVHVQKTRAPMSTDLNPCASRFVNAQFNSRYEMPSTSSSIRSIRTHASAHPVFDLHHPR